MNHCPKKYQLGGKLVVDPMTNSPNIIRILWQTELRITTIIEILGVKGLIAVYFGIYSCLFHVPLALFCV